MRIKQSIVTIATIAMLLMLFTARSSFVTAAGKQTLSKKELKELIKTASTKADHEKLADYYKAEAERLEAEAKDHDEMGEMYKKNPSPLAAKHPEAFGEAHCREMARRLREAAADAQSLAEMHAAEANAIQ